MPYPEFYRWQLFYELEPWGFASAEYSTAALLTMLHNINSPLKKNKSIKYFIRDMLKAFVNALKEPLDPAEMTREQLLQQVKKDLGIQ